MALKLGNIMGDIIDQVHLQLPRLLPQRLFKHLADPIHNHLPVGPGIVGGASHRGKIRLPLRGVGRGAGQLTVGERISVFPTGRADRLEIIRANLMSQTPGATVDHHRNLVFLDPKALGQAEIEDFVNILDLEKMVPGTKGTQLRPASLFGPFPDQSRISAGQTAPLLGMLQIAFPTPTPSNHPGTAFP